MRTTKITAATFAVTLAPSTMAAGSASASGWHVNGTELTGSETRALAAEAKMDTPLILNVPALPLKISCKGPLGVGGSLIKAPNLIDSGLELTECVVTEPLQCELSAPTIGSNAIEGAANTTPSLADHILFKARTGNEFFELALVGSSCAPSGRKAVTGTVVFKVPTGPTENTLQPIEGLGSLEQGSHVRVTHAGKRAWVTLLANRQVQYEP